MFNIGATELIVILFIAFLVVGPKDLPKVARALGRFVRYIRSMMEEVKRETGLDEVESSMKDVEKDVQSIKKDVDIRPDLQKTQLNLNKELSGLKKDINEGLSFKDFKNQHGTMGK